MRRILRSRSHIPKMSTLRSKTWKNSVLKHFSLELEGSSESFWGIQYFKFPKYSVKLQIFFVEKRVEQPFVSIFLYFSVWTIPYDKYMHPPLPIFKNQDNDVDNFWIQMMILRLPFLPITLLPKRLLHLLFPAPKRPALTFLLMILCVIQPGHQQVVLLGICEFNKIVLSLTYFIVTIEYSSYHIMNIFNLTSHLV